MGTRVAPEDHTPVDTAGTANKDQIFSDPFHILFNLSDNDWEEDTNDESSSEDNDPPPQPCPPCNWDAKRGVDLDDPPAKQWRPGPAPEPRPASVRIDHDAEHESEQPTTTVSHNRTGDVHIAVYPPGSSEPNEFSWRHALQSVVANCVLLSIAAGIMAVARWSIGDWFGSNDDTEPESSSMTTYEPHAEPWGFLPELWVLTSTITAVAKAITAHDYHSSK